MLFICYIIYKACKWLSGKALIWYTLGPGFDSQVPSFLHIIFLSMFACSAPSRSSPYVHNPSVPHGSESQSKGPDLMNTILVGQPGHTRAEEVKRSLQQMGQIADSLPPNWGQHPLVFVFLFLFPILFLFALI